MKASNLTRHTFNLGGRTLKYSALSHYVCNDCGGRVTHRATRDPETEATTNSVACAGCGCDDIISERRYLEQISDGYEVADGLPPELAALLRPLEQFAWTDEEIEHWNLVLPDRLSSVKQHENEQKAIVKGRQ